MARTLAAWWNDRSLRWKGIIVVSFPVAALLGVTVLFGTASIAANRSADAYEEAVRVSTAVDRLTNHLSTAEAGLRGYLLTDDDMFLEPYFRIVAGLPESKADVVAALAEDTEFAHLIEAFTIRTERLEAISVEILDAGARNERGIDLLLLDGETTLDELRGLALVVRNSEAEEIRLAEADRRRWNRVATSAAWLGVGLSALGGIAGSIVFTRSISRRVRRNSENAELRSEAIRCSRRRWGATRSAGRARRWSRRPGGSGWPNVSWPNAARTSNVRTRSSNASPTSPPTTSRSRCAWWRATSSSWRPTSRERSGPTRRSRWGSPSTAPNGCSG